MWLTYMDADSSNIEKKTSESGPHEEIHGALLFLVLWLIQQKSGWSKVNFMATSQSTARTESLWTNFKISKVF
jgi:hypothetical protein